MNLSELTINELHQLKEQINNELASRYTEQAGGQPRDEYDNIDWSQVEEEAMLDSTPPEDVDWQTITPEQEHQLWEQCENPRFVPSPARDSREPARRQRTRQEQQEQRAAQRDNRVTNSRRAAQQEVTEHLPPSDWKMGDIKQACYRMLRVATTTALKRHVDTSDLNLRRKADWQTLYSRLSQQQ